MLPVDVMVGVSTGMMVAVIVGLSIWNGWYGKRGAARARAWAAEHQPREQVPAGGTTS